MEAEELLRPFPPELALHFLAGSSSIIALDHAKRLLDAKTHSVHFPEPDTHLTPLHIASTWSNLAMCQLLIHYNANPLLKDEHGNTCIDLAGDKKVRRFLKKMSSNSRPREKKRIRMLLAEMFGFKSSLSNDKKKRTISCFPAKLSASTPLIRRRSLQIKNEFKQRTDDDIEKIIARLKLVGTKELMEVKENIVPVTPKKQMYPILPTAPAVPPTPPRVSSLSPNITIRRQPAPFPRFDVTPSAPVETDYEDNNEEEPRTPDVPKDVLSLTMDQLRTRLGKVGISPGPLHTGTRKLYEKKLVIAEKQNVETYQNQEFSAILDRFLRMIERNEVIRIGQLQEDIIRNEFCLGPIITREKNEVSSFCYLLIDPSKIADQRNCTFRQFLEAIFYIGKGKRCRPLQHLVDAAKCKRQGNLKGRPPSEKLKRICKLWESGHGVVSLHVFLNIHPNEALIREAAMIDTYGLKNLTNVKSGEYSGVAKNWTMKDKTEFGALCIYSAWGIFKNDRCRPVFESDVTDALNQKLFYH